MVFHVPADPATPATRGLHMVDADVRQTGLSTLCGTGVEPVTARSMVWCSTVELTYGYRRSLRQNPIAEHARPTTLGRAGRAAGLTAPAKYRAVVAGNGSPKIASVNVTEGVKGQRRLHPDPLLARRSTPQFEIQFLTATIRGAENLRGIRAE